MEVLVYGPGLSKDDAGTFFSGRGNGNWELGKENKEGFKRKRGESVKEIGCDTSRPRLFPDVSKVSLLTQNRYSKLP